MQRLSQRLRARHDASAASRAPRRRRSCAASVAFALYGFPESHAASFALIAYASAYLKCHHPAAFLAGLLNAWPMGFYAPATLVKDAQRHGVEVRPIDVARSSWKCTLEPGRRAERGEPPARRAARACATRAACASRQGVALAAERARAALRGPRGSGAAGLAAPRRARGARRARRAGRDRPVARARAARRSGRWPGSSAIRTRCSRVSRRTTASLRSPRRRRSRTRSPTTGAAASRRAHT